MGDSVKLTGRRRFLQATGAATAFGLAGCIGADDQDDGEAPPDDDFPSETIRVVVPYGEGGGTDVYARGLQPYLEDAWGTSIIIDNVPGAAELRGTTEAFHADADGYTLCFNNGPQLTGVMDPEGQPVEWWEMEPIGSYAYTAYTPPARPDEGVEEWPDLVEKFETDEYRAWTGQAVGGGQWTTSMIFQMTDVVPFDEYIGYNSSAEQAQAILSGEADSGLPTETTMSEWDHELDPIVTTSAQGSTTFPDLPTVEDYGYDAPPTGDFTRGINTPPGVPDDRLEILRDGFQEAIEGPAQEFEEETGNVVQYLPPDAWAEVWQEGHIAIMDLLDEDQLTDLRVAAAAG